MNKQLKITDKHTGKEYNVAIYTSRHAFERFLERSNIVPNAEERINKAIENAASNIINNYSDIDGEYVIKSKSTGLKIILKVDKPHGNHVSMSIPTMLSMTMTADKEKGIPSFAMEDVLDKMRSELL